jgi:hypothetical protein
MDLAWLQITHARAYGMSYDDELNEIQAEKCLMAAIAEMSLAIEEVNTNSVLVEIEPSAFGSLPGEYPALVQRCGDACPN